VESDSPPHKRSKVTHEEKPDSHELNDNYDENTDPNIQSCNSLAYEPVNTKIIVSQPDLASDLNNDETQGPTMTVDNIDNTQVTNMDVSATSNNGVQPVAQVENVAVKSSLAVSSLEKEFDSPVKEIKFSFPCEDSEATQPTDQPSLEAAVSIQTDQSEHSSLTNSVNSAQNTAQQSLMTSTNSINSVVVSFSPLYNSRMSLIFVTPAESSSRS
jgi:hypothetical protein